MNLKKKRIILDVNHPGDVHFIKNLYFELIKRKNIVLVVASKKPLTYELLEGYNIPYKKIGSYGSTNFSKAINLVWLNIKMFFIVLKFKPDLMLGTVSFRSAQIGWVLNIKSFCFDDTEHAVEQVNLIKPFAYKILTAPNYKYSFGKKHIYYEGYHELAYLHPHYYNPDSSILNDLGVSIGEKYTIIRFVAWNATHDAGMIGFSDTNKIKAVKQFLQYGKVFITSEIPLPKEIQKYIIKIPYTKIHDAIFYSSLVFGESSTMSSEAAVLGIPSVFVDDEGRCYTNEQEECYGLVNNFKLSQQKEAIKKGVEIISKPYIFNKKKYKERQQKLLRDKIDVTAFQLSLIENH